MPSPEGEWPEGPAAPGLDGGAPDGHWQDGEQSSHEQRRRRDSQVSRNDRAERQRANGGARKAEEKARRQAGGAATSATTPVSAPPPTQPGSVTTEVPGDVGRGVGSPDAVRQETERLRREKGGSTARGDVGGAARSGPLDADLASSNRSRGVRLGLVAAIVVAAALALAVQRRRRGPDGAPGSAVDAVEQPT